jgi:hypothetical protein
MKGVKVGMSFYTFQKLKNFSNKTVNLQTSKLVVTRYSSHEILKF